MTVDDVRKLLSQNSSPDARILLDDGEYYIEAESEESGLLLRIRSMALLEEDDAECHGGYSRRGDGTWIAQFRANTEPDDDFDRATSDEGDEIEVYTVEGDDREHVIAMLWLMRHSTIGFRTDET